MAKKPLSNSRNSSNIKPLKREVRAVSPVRQSPVPKPQAAAATGPIDVTQDMIARRAYLIWESSGGSDFDNWVRAERELRGL